MNIILMQKIFLLLGALLAFVGVAAGAFGAHALKQKLGADMLTIFEVGVRYQMYHAFAMMISGLVLSLFQNNFMMSSGWVFLAGTVVFSGSLYVLALTGVRTWGAVTPVGGLLLLLGWLCFAIGIIKH